MKITDTDRLNWIIKQLWQPEEMLLSDAYFESKSLRQAIDHELRKTKQYKSVTAMVNDISGEKFKKAWKKRKTRRRGKK